MSKVKFRHLIDAGEIGSGTIKFKNYADVNAWRISDNVNPRATRLVLGVYNVVNGEIGTLAKSYTMDIQPGMIIPTPDTSAMTDGVKFIGWLDNGNLIVNNFPTIKYRGIVNGQVIFGSTHYGAVWQSATYASKDDVPLSMVIDETAKAFATVKFNFASVPEGTRGFVLETTKTPYNYNVVTMKPQYFESEPDDPIKANRFYDSDPSWTMTLFAESGTSSPSLSFKFRTGGSAGTLAETGLIKVESVSTETVTEVQATFLAKLATPQNVTANGTTVSWDAVENATSYDVLADGTSIGEVNN